MSWVWKEEEDFTAAAVLSESQWAMQAEQIAGPRELSNM